MIQNINPKHPVTFILLENSGPAPSDLGLSPWRGLAFRWQNGTNILSNNGFARRVVNSHPQTVSWKPSASIAAQKAQERARRCLLEVRSSCDYHALVCKSWKKLIYSSPRLWSSVTVNSNHLRIGHAAVRLFVNWLNRAKSHPLTIELNFEGTVHHRTMDTPYAGYFVGFHRDVVLKVRMEAFNHTPSQ